jgi:hypothetical protein
VKTFVPRARRVVPAVSIAIASLAYAAAFSPARADGPATFANYAAPGGLGTDAGEPSIGVDWKTGNVMYQAGLQTLRVGFDDGVAPAAASWVNATPATSRETFDPILFTDSATGRTVVSQLISSLVVPGGGCSLSSTSDDDGATWIPATGCGAPGAYDHQSVGGGPFAAPIPRGVNEHAMYYCGQSGLFANCALSLDGGQTYGAGVPLYSSTATPVTARCQGLHGHVKVGPDGTAYVPNFDCGGSMQAAVVSRDNGLTWKANPIPDSEYNGFRSDPSIGIGSDNTVYFAYESPEGPVKVAVSQDHGTTWTSSVDLATPAGVSYAIFPAVVAGDGDRAAVAFLGASLPTTLAKDYESSAYAGAWHLYVSMTYDRGATWTTTDVTPSDPVQRGCVWWGNGTCPSAHRNLLDFMDATLDSHGRVLVGYADGCIRSCVTGTNNTNSKLATIARQTSGKTLFAAFD